MQWEIAAHPVPYEDALARMEARVADIHTGAAEELVWLLEHPPLYTAGTSAKAADLLKPRFPVYDTGRGGQYTYHGPGQRVAYVMMDLRKKFGKEETPLNSELRTLNSATPDLRRFVQQLETWIILTLAEFGVKGELREGRVGVWVVEKSSEFGVRSSENTRSVNQVSPEPSPGVNDSSHEQGQHKESKIAALGIRVRRGIAYHGIALNVHPDLSHYAGIVPCGIREHGVTSLHALGVMATMEDVDAAMKRCFETVFGKR